jgi:hypothetical protein
MMNDSHAEASPHSAAPPLRATFILRMWHERLDDDRAEWRGVAEYVQGGERRAFASTDGAQQALESWLEALRREPDSESHSGR